MNFNVGNLYQIKKYFWYLYPSKDGADEALRSGRIPHSTDTEASASRSIVYWSKELKCNVTYIAPNSIFCLIEQDGEYLKVLSTNGELGWMIYSEDEAWTKGTIEEIKQ